MTDILQTILGLLSGIPVIGDIITKLMETLGMGEEGAADDGQSA